MNRDEINEAFGVTDDQLDRMAEPYESEIRNQHKSDPSRHA